METSLQIAGIAVGFGMLEAALWSPPRYQFPVGLAALFWMIVVTLWRRTPAQQLGLDLRAWTRGIIVPLSAATLCLICLGGALMLAPAFAVPPHAAARMFGYTFWAFIQEFMLLAFFFVGVERIAGARRAVFVASLLFAIAHLPNPVLTAVTLVTALVFTTAFARYRSVYSIALAHALLGLTFAIVIPVEWHHGMHVGWGYSRWKPKAAAVHVHQPPKATEKRFP